MGAGRVGARSPTRLAPSLLPWVPVRAFVSPPPSDGVRHVAVFAGRQGLPVCTSSLCLALTRVLPALGPEETCLGL